MHKHSILSLAGSTIGFNISQPHVPLLPGRARTAALSSAELTDSQTTSVSPHLHTKVIVGPLQLGTFYEQRKKGLKAAASRENHGSGLLHFRTEPQQGPR